MQAVAYAFMIAALATYGLTIRASWRLVAESRTLKSGVRFNRFWWTPAWKLHRRAFPESRIRMQVVMWFALTFGLMLAGMGCLACSILGNLRS